MRPPGLAGVVLTAGALVAYGAVATVLVVRNLYYPGPPYAESALRWSVPSPYNNSGQYIGMEHFTADVLNRTHPAAQWGRIDYVPAGVASTRPDTVSVNPVDEYTWGGAAFSVRTSRCYLILSSVDPSNTRFGKTLYGSLSPGAPCLGSAATPTSVRLESEPPE